MHGHQLMAEVLTDWDRMLLAKHSPGTMNAPFMQAMGVSTITPGVVKGSFSMQYAWSLTSAKSEPIGTDDYVVIMFSPS